MASSVVRNNELFPAVVAGDVAARATMIEENMALVVVKADSLIKQIPGLAYLRDDLVSAGYIGLLKAVNEVPSGRVRMKSLNTWIGRSVVREMRKLLPHERSIHIPQESSRRARMSKQPIDTPVVTNVLPDNLQTDSHTAAVELRDTFAVCCKSEQERECLRLREEGYTFVEIAERLGIGKSLAHDMFARLRTRIFSRLDEP